MLKKRIVAIIFSAVFAITGGGIAAAASRPETAKYVFVFIGDGMGIAQRNAAELYMAGLRGEDRPERVKLTMNTFPAQGMNTTYDLTSVIPDSASTATAIATGFKTKSGVIGMDATQKISYPNIAEAAKKKGWKVGILSSVSLDHATPAAFYAHVPHRGQMYDINLALANSGFDYFAGGQMLRPVDAKNPGKPNALDIARKNGYKVLMGRTGFDQIKRGAGKIIAMNETVDKDGAMYYALDQNGDKNQVSLAEYTAKGIELLNNPKGFLMMVEGGKIDWACHANDAAASIHDTLAFDEAIQEAVKFFTKHPRETLILVTGDHETGGMTIGFAGTRYSSFVDKIRHQKASYIEFGKKLEEYKKGHTVADAKIEDILPMIHDTFGFTVHSPDEEARMEKIVMAGKAKTSSPEEKKAAKDAEKSLKYSMALTKLELAVLRDALKQSMLGKKERAADDYTYLLYGGYEPLSIKLTTILNNKAGIGWTSYSHTGVPVQTSALGVGSSLFNGYYDQTDIHAKLCKIAKLK